MIMKKLMALPLFLLYAGQAHALKYVIFTDQPDGKKAEEVVQMMKSTYPFSAHNVDFEIVKLKKEELDCGSRSRDKNGEIIKRAVTCEGNNGFQNMAARRGGDQAMIIKDLDYHGGTSSSGGVPVMTTGSHPRVMLHEYMHTLGLCDEYDYPQSEADAHCDDMGDTPNATVFEPRPSYGSDEEARRIHTKDIPWYSSILETTKITNGSSLGTGTVANEKEVPNNSNMPLVLAEPIGLFKGRVCKNATKPKTSWLPGGKKTVMDDYTAGLGPYNEKQVEKILFSKGSSRKMEVKQPEVVVRDEGSLELPEVNDSPRNFFKDLFEMIGNFFKGLFNTISR